MAVLFQKRWSYSGQKCTLRMRLTFFTRETVVAARADIVVPAVAETAASFRAVGFHFDPV